ncbi:DUF2267 domain-containing protein [Streptomyces sp. NPDC001642]|uniref:DUF2267 domain-containing protein n=1 Tax=Streptomyces sp. NPDC001642 TaxID=3154392 RepID=UPI003319FDD6
MLALREPSSPQAGVTFHQMLERIRYEGAYPTLQRAEDVTRTVLQALGRQLSAEARAELAACLPADAASALADHQPHSGPLTGWGFVKDLATRTDTAPAVARWDTGAVLSVVGRLAGEALITRIIEQLPEGYALLFGRAELVRAA